MAAYNIYIDTGFFIVTDVPVVIEHIRNPRASTTFEFDGITESFQFFFNVPNANGTTDQRILGINVNEFLYSDLTAVTETIAGVPTVIPIANARALATYLSSKLAVTESGSTTTTVTITNPVIPKENTSTYKQLAQIQPASKNTAELLYSPGADEEVHISSVKAVNLDGKDITVKLYCDDDGTTWDDTTIVAYAKVKKKESENLVTKESEIYMNDQTGSLGFESSDTDCTVTVFGTIYDLS